MHTILKQETAVKFSAHGTIPVFFKLELQQFLSPITIAIKFHCGNDHDKSVIVDHEKQEENAMMYGSFTNNIPTIKDHDIHCGSTKKMKITHLKGKEVFDDKFFYLSFVTPIDRTITFTARSRIMDEKKKLAKIDKVIVGREDINLKAHSDIKDAMTNKVKREYLIGHMNEILEGQDKFNREKVDHNKKIMPFYPLVL